MNLLAQNPSYSFKKFVSKKDSIEFRSSIPSKNGISKTYILSRPIVWDLDDSITTFIRGEINALLYFEGPFKNGKKEGVFSVYLIDSIDHLKKYKIWEQNYSNDKLNGKWLTYTLGSILVSSQTFKNDSLNGLSKYYWIDGKKALYEVEYFNGRKQFVERNFFENGRLKSEIPYYDNKKNGIGKKYYESGTIKEIASFKNDQFNGSNKYFYPNGRLWSEIIYKMGKSWRVVVNYTESGQSRDPGTLHDGNGTIIYYNEDGTIREIKAYKNGEKTD